MVSAPGYFGLSQKTKNHRRDDFNCIVAAMFSTQTDVMIRSPRPTVMERLHLSDLAVEKRSHSLSPPRPLARNVNATHGGFMSTYVNHSDDGFEV